MKTTVIIPNYNGIEYLKNCIKSLDNMVSSDFAIIVIDNGSSDGSGAWLDEVVKSREGVAPIQVITNKENVGFAAAVNQGIVAAKTEYVLLLNNDTEVDSSFIVAMEEAIESSDKVFSVSARMVTMQDNSIIDGAGDYYCALGWAYAYGKGKSAEKYCLKRKKIFSACGGAAIYKRDILMDMGMFDELHFAYLEDVDVGYRARINGYSNIYEPSAVCIHAGSASSGSRYNEFKIRLTSRNSTYIIIKNMPFLQRFINLPFFIIGFSIKFLFFTLKGYGKLYLSGLFKGIKLAYSDEGRAKKVPFKYKNIGNILSIQLELWCNVIRRFFA